MQKIFCTLKGGVLVSIVNQNSLVFAILGGSVSLKLKLNQYPLNEGYCYCF